MITNALTIDVEDYYHVSAFDSVIGYENWSSQESRIEDNVGQMLDILAQEGVRATFFVLGWVAEHFPDTILAIHRAGHEIATHGYAHQLIYEQSPQEFRADLRRSLDVIEGLIGERVLGYRAPSFSITEQSMWAVEILDAFDLRYDSSIFPTEPLVHSRYGLPGSPNQPYRIRGDLWEFPITTFRLLGRDLPVGGGGWLRHYPYPLTRWGLRRVNADGRPAVVYVHPWELDPGQPRLNGSRWSQFLHYRNLDKTAQRLRALCRDFQFAPIREVLDV